MKVASGILSIAADTKEICLLWRSPEVKDGNRWGLIGGMCKDGLTPAEGALLEMQEEVGYSGPIELHTGHLCRVRGFEYHNFIGIVPTAFPYFPEAEFAWESCFIEWLSYSRIQNMIELQSSTFHKGLLELFQESKELIEKFV